LLLGINISEKPATPIFKVKKTRSCTAWIVATGYSETSVLSNTILIFIALKTLISSVLLLCVTPKSNFLPTVPCITLVLYTNYKPGVNFAVQKQTG
jgi:hypothetical protein